MTPAEILAARRELGMAQQEFAALLGVNLMTVSRWERGVYTPSPLSVREIRRQLDIYRNELARQHRFQKIDVEVTA